MELLNDLQPQDDVVKREVGDEKSDGGVSTDDYDFTAGCDGLDCESEQKAEVVSTFNCDSQEEVLSGEGQASGTDKRADFPDLKVVLCNIGKSRIQAGRRKNGAVEMEHVGEDSLGLDLDNDDLTIGNVISVSICESDGVSYPNVVIKEEICDVESDVLTLASEPGLA